MRALVRTLLAIIILSALSTAEAIDQVNQESNRDFADTVTRLQWAFGGYGLTTVIAIVFQQLLTKIKVHTGRAAIFEIMRRDWAKTLLHEDAALGWILPLRVYVFEQSDGKTMVSYARPSALLEDHQSDVLRALGRQLDQKLHAVVTQAVIKPRE
jgi:uncharacterized protein (DUF302 family)